MYCSIIHYYSPNNLALYNKNKSIRFLQIKTGTTPQVHIESFGWDCEFVSSTCGNDKPSGPAGGQSTQSGHVYGSETNHGRGISLWRKNPYAVPCTGGKPNADWTGLETKVVRNNPNLLRSNDTKSNTAYESRRSRLSTKYKSGDDTTSFLKELRKQFVNKGMYTVCYRKDPLDKTKMINVLDHFPRLNKDLVKKQRSWFIGKYDDYDWENDENAKEFLWNSLGSKL